MQENEDAFSVYANEYDAWFDKHTTFYKKEIACVKKLIGSALGGLDIGAGSGRFSLKPAITVLGVRAKLLTFYTLSQSTTNAPKIISL